MSTENSQETTSQETTAPQHTDVEQRAMEMGWRPKEEFEGDEADFVDAKEFISRKPLYDKISQQSKQFKNVQRALDALKEHHTKVAEVEYRRALNDLKAQRKEALVQGDAEAFEKAEDQIKEAETKFTEIKQSVDSIKVEDEPVLHPNFVNWKARNPWYDSTGYMRAFADDVGARLHRTGLAPDDVLKEVEKAVRKEFPNKFRNPNKDDAPDVSSSKGTSPAPKGAKYQLTDQEYKIMKTLTSSGTMTEDQYISELKKIKGT